MSGLRVAVVGASGHTGGEACRLLLGHPGVETILPTARRDEPFERVHRNLLGCGLMFADLDDVVAAATRGEVDVALLCLPSGRAMRLAPDLLATRSRVIDLGPDFRFGDAATYEAMYGRPHESPELLGEAVYGVTELARDRLPAARLVANPGCYVITAILALAPLIDPGGAARSGVDVDARIRISAVNGTTGAGSEPRREVMHPEVVGTMLPYSLNGHRHAGEMEEHLGALAGRPAEVELNCAHADFARGIYLQATLDVATAAALPEQQALVALYEERYGPGSRGERFVRVNDAPRSGQRNAKDYLAYPSIRAVVGSNHCHVGVDVDPRLRLVKATATVDNLVKGAAGSAIQNMNVMCGLPEHTGLEAYAL